MGVTPVNAHKKEVQLDTLWLQRLARRTFCVHCDCVDLESQQFDGRQEKECTQARKSAHLARIRVKVIRNNVGK